MREQRKPLGIQCDLADLDDLPALLATLPPAAPEPAPPGDWSRLTYPRLLVQQYAEAFLRDDAARYHLLRLQAEALETEAAALAVLLGE